MLQRMVNLNFDLLVHSLGALKEEGIRRVERHSSTIGEHLVLTMATGGELSVICFKQEYANQLGYRYEVMDREGEVHAFSAFIDLTVYVNELVFEYILGTV